MKKQFIYTDDDLFNKEWREEWTQYQREWREDDSYEPTDEEWYEEVTNTLGDEKMNLNKEIEGVIIAFADLGLWNGRKQGYRIMGTNINNIFDVSADHNEWYGDGNNIRSIHAHHDGTNYVLFRVAKNMESAKRICEKIYNGEIDEKGFRKRTKSLYPYVAKIYGWNCKKFEKKK